MAYCYRHPDRETGVSCSNCGRPICPDCMTATPVGMRCPECSKQTTKVRTARTVDYQPVVTYGLIAINALIWIGMSTRAGAFSTNLGTITGDFGLIKGIEGLGGVADGEYYRLITSAFLHAQNPLHVLFNMYILYFLGNLLEVSMGPFRFAALYLASALTGAFAVLLFSPDSLTVGASGAIFGLMGATFVMQYARGIDPMQSGIGPMILLNLALGFIIPNVSIAGHVGGLVGGAAAGWLMDQAQSRSRGQLLPIAACVLVGGAALAGSVLVASS